MKKIIVVFCILLWAAAGNGLCKRASDESVILKRLDIALEKFTEKIELIPDHIKRVTFFSIKVDKENISRSLFRQIQGKIESKFLEFQRPVMVYAPEVKPIKIVATDDGVKFATDLQTTEQIKDIAGKLRLDGLMEGSLCVSSKKLYLTLRIFDTDSMAVAWSQSFDSTAEKPEAKPKTTGVDFGFGTAGVYINETGTTVSEVPEFVQYYMGHLRIAQKISYVTRIYVTLTGSFLYMYDGIVADKRTGISSKTGKGPINFTSSIGIRIPIIPVKTKDNKGNRDWLAAELKMGKLWAVKSSTKLMGFKFESDITRNLSISAGLSYAGKKSVVINAGEEVKAGGLLYEVSLLQFNYRP